VAVDEQIQDSPDVGTPAPPQTDPVEKYYNYLKTAGADVAPNLDSFKKTLSNDKTAQQYYNYLRQNKFDAPPTYGSFARTLGITQATAPSPAPTPVPEHEVQHNSLQDIRHIQDLASQPVQTVSNNVNGVNVNAPDPDAIAANRSYNAQYDKMATDMGGQWGAKPEVVKQVLLDFPGEQDETKLKSFASLASQNPVAYARLKNANDIRQAIAQDGPNGIHDANAFNAAQQSGDYYHLTELNIPFQQQLIRDHNLGPGAEEKLRETQRPLINSLDPGLISKLYTGPDKELGLSADEYAGLETERLFQPNKYQMDMDVIKHSRGIGEDGKANPLDMSTQPYTYQRGVENTKYGLAQIGRQNLQMYIAEKRPELDKQVNDLVQTYKDKMASANPAEQVQLQQQFNEEPVVQKANDIENGAQQLQYSQSEDNRLYPLNFNDQATRLVRDAIQSNGSQSTPGVVGKLVSGVFDTQKGTYDFVKNLAINIAGSDESKAFNNAESSGQKSISDLTGYYGSKASGVEQPLNVPRGIINAIQGIQNDPELSDADKQRMSVNYLKDNWDQLTANPKSGQQNLTGKSLIYGASDMAGQIMGIASQSFLLGGVIGDASKVQKLAAAFTPMYMSTQDQLYQQAVKDGDEHPLAKSHLDAAIISLASLINPDLKVVKGAAGVETPMGKMIAGVSEDTWNKVLSENKPIVDQMSGAVKATARQMGLAQLQYGLIAPTGQYIVHRALGEDANLGDMIKDGVVNTAIQMAAPSLLHGLWGGVKAADVNPMQKYALVEAGLKPDQNIDLVDSQIKSGQISEVQGHEVKMLIKHAGEFMLDPNLKMTDGTPMNERQVADNLYNSIKKKALETSLKTAPEPLKPVIQEKIHEVNKEIADGFTSDADKRTAELNQLLHDNLDRIKDKAPEMEQKVKDAIKQNTPEDIYKEIADQAKETKSVEGKEVSNREEVEKVFGKPLVEKAIELSKQKTKSNGKDSQGEQAGQGRQITSEKPSEDSGTSVAAGLPESSFLESRHADTADDEKGLVSGPNDNPISKEGRKDANDLAKSVEGKGVTKVITSDLERAKQTGQIVADKTGAVIEHRPELNTWDIGDFDKASDEEFKKAQKFFVENPDAKEYDGKHINESFNEYKDRVIKARTSLENEPASTLVVNHSNNMMLWDAYVKNGHEWNAQAEKDYLSAKTPEPATLTDKSQQNATANEPAATSQDQSSQDNAGTQSQEPGTAAEEPQPNPAAPQTAKPVEEDWPFVEEESDNKVTSTRNAVTEKKVEEAGLMPAMKAAKREFGEVWDEAQKKINKGFDVEGLIDKLAKKPRAVTDLENAMILYHQNVKEAQLDAVNKDLNEAKTKGDEAGVVENETIRAGLMDSLQKLYDVDKAIGTETARGLNARKMMVDRRFSLVNMQMEKSAANGGEPLTKEQAAEVQKQYDTIRETSAAYEARIKELEEENKKLAAAQLVQKLDRDVKAEKIKKKQTAIKQDIKDNFAELRKIARNQGLSANPFAPEMIPVIGKIAKNLVRLGINSVEGITNHIYNELKGDFDGLTPDHVMEALEAATNAEKLKAYKERLTQSTEDITEKVNKGDFSKPNKKTQPVLLDKKARALKAENERAKEAFELGVKRDQQKSRSGFQKAQDAFVKIERAAKLSSPITLAKLTAAAVTRLVTEAPEELIGAGYSAILPKLAKGALGEGGANVKAMAKGYKEAFTQGMKDSANMLQGKKTDLEAVYGKKGHLPSTWIDFMGSLHGALKAPVKRFAFERSLEKRYANAIKAGVDVSDPLVQAKLAMDSYKTAQRAIFMQDNFVSKSYSNFVEGLERSKAFTNSGKAAATLFRWMIPFVKVPTNIVGEVGTMVGGVPYGAGKIVHAVFTKGLDGLSSDEKDTILRSLKKGTIGLGALSLGYLRPDLFGGYYQKDNKDKNGLKPGSIKVAGHEVPVWLLESPIFQTMQLGATIRKVKDAKVSGGGTKGTMEGVWAGAMGLASHEPLVDAPERFFKVFDGGKERDRYFDQLAQSTLEPALLNNIADWVDGDKARKPTDLKQTMEMGIPGLRQNVPLKGATAGRRPRGE